MKERPILFSGPMVNALLAGRKTQTRRICKLAEKLRPSYKSHRVCWNEDGPWWEFHGKGTHVSPGAVEKFFLDCPYGVPGDRLWCKHTHWYKPASDLTPEVVWSEHFPRAFHRDHSGTWESDIPSTLSEIERHGGFRKRPSIHMPRWASRITLEVARVRVERVQDITEEDAIAEGLEGGESFKGGGEGRLFTPRENFLRLFYDINKRAPRDANPWVWCIEFTLVEQRAEAAG